MKDFYEWCKRKYYQNGKEKQTDPPPPSAPTTSLPAAFVLYEDTDCFVVLIRNKRYLIPKGENQK